MVPTLLNFPQMHPKIELAAELRNRIYELVLFNSSGLHEVKGVPKPVFSANSNHMAQEFNLIK